MSNIWNCNYALWQGGHMRFVYHLTSHEGAGDRVAAAQFGWGNASPLLARSSGPQHGAWPEMPLSLLTVDQANVIVPVMKRAENGDGWIVRLYETGGRAATRTTVRLGFAQPESVYRATLAEEDLEQLPLIGDCVSVTLAPHELATLHVRAGRHKDPSQPQRGSSS
jgi:alpha-mannosidase